MTESIEINEIKIYSPSPTGNELQRLPDRSNSLVNVQIDEFDDQFTNCSIVNDVNNEIKA